MSDGAAFSRVGTRSGLQSPSNGHRWLGSSPDAGCGHLECGPRESPGSTAEGLGSRPGDLEPGVPVGLSPMCDSEEQHHPEPSKCPELREASEAPEKQLAAQSRDPSETAWGLRGGWGSRAWGQEQGRAGGGQGATWVPGALTLGVCFPSHPTQQLRMLVGVCESVCL